MNTVIKGTKTIAEFKQVRETMENLAREKIKEEIECH